MAKREDLELWSQDECHFQRHGTRCRVWVPPENKDPVVLHAPTRQPAACFGAVSLRSGKFVHAFSPVFNAVKFEGFLKTPLRRRSRGRKMVLVLDNARYHHAKLLKPLLEERKAHLELLFLPPCSPQLASHRTGLEACAAGRHPQSLLRQPGRVAVRRRDLFRPVAQTESRLAEIMRHNLRRYV